MSNLSDITIKEILPSSIAEDQNVQELGATGDSYLHEIFEQVQCILLLPNLDTLPEDVVDICPLRQSVAWYGRQFTGTLSKALRQLSKRLSPMCSSLRLYRRTGNMAATPTTSG